MVTSKRRTSDDEQHYKNEDGRRLIQKKNPSEKRTENRSCLRFLYFARLRFPLVSNKF